MDLGNNLTIHPYHITETYDSSKPYIPCLLNIATQAIHTISFSKNFDSNSGLQSYQKILAKN